MGSDGWVVNSPAELQFKALVSGSFSGQLHIKHGKDLDLKPTQQ